MREKIDKSNYLFTNKMLVALILPFIALYNGGGAIFRAQGNSEIPMRVSIMVNIINVGGNWKIQKSNKALTKGTIYPIGKSVSKWFGVKMTKDIVSREHIEAEADDW